MQTVEKIQAFVRLRKPASEGQSPKESSGQSWFLGNPGWSSFGRRGGSVSDEDWVNQANENAANAYGDLVEALEEALNIRVEGKLYQEAQEAFLTAIKALKASSTRDGSYTHLAQSLDRFLKVDTSGLDEAGTIVRLTAAIGALKRGAVSAQEYANLKAHNEHLLSDNGHLRERNRLLEAALAGSSSRNSVENAYNQGHTDAIKAVQSLVAKEPE